MQVPAGGLSGQAPIDASMETPLEASEKKTRVYDHVVAQVDGQVPPQEVDGHAGAVAIVLEACEATKLNIGASYL